MHAWMTRRPFDVYVFSITVFVLVWYGRVLYKGLDISYIL